MEWDGLSMIEEEDHDQKSTRGATPSRRGSRLLLRPLQPSDVSLTEKIVVGAFG